MARRLTRREIALVGVLLAIAIGFLWFRSEDPFGGGVGAKDMEDAASLGAAPSVRMDLLDPKDVTFDQAGRDLFKYGKKPLTAEELAALEARRRAEEEARRRAQDEAQKRREQAQAKARPTPQPTRQKPSLPRIDLDYIGYLGPKDDRIAVFEDDGKVVLARAGEIVKEQFRVVEIQYESVVMGYTRSDLADKTQTLSMARR